MAVRFALDATSGDMLFDDVRLCPSDDRKSGLLCLAKFSPVVDNPWVGALLDVVLDTLPMSARIVFMETGIERVYLYSRLPGASLTFSRAAAEAKVTAVRHAFSSCGVDLNDQNLGIARFSWGQVWSNYGHPNILGSDGPYTSHEIEYR